MNRQDELFAASKAPRSDRGSEPTAAPSTTRNIGGAELPNFGNDQFELPDFLKRGNF